ncbi:hypothetical protein KC318_g62 [Hortaea werneckii]|nr:hypothetical protein KC334_g59 [Hortaea werneckii]KAI7028379.1 hypothetical protein KC355_g61 [Hortaea werneckii]KAI7676796.1 hypothetical protein KC318_g62 [Hortaea werneckii]
MVCSTRKSSLQLAALVTKLFSTHCLVVNHLDQAHIPTIVLPREGIIWQGRKVAHVSQLLCLARREIAVEALRSVDNIVVQGSSYVSAYNL